MDDPDVASGEMGWLRHHRDEIDAVLGDGLVDDDLADVAAVVHDLRSAYLRDEPMPRQPALLAFTAMPLDDKGEPLVTAVSNAHGSAPQTAGLPNRDTTRRKNKMLETVSALVATLAGKAGSQSQDPEEIETTDEDGEPSEAAADGQETAEAAQTKQEAAAAFTTDMEEWSTCAEEAGEAELNPVEECGERPHPSDYGLTEPPTSQADSADRPETTPAPDAATQGADNDPSDQGTNTPPQPPADDAATTTGADNDPSDQGTDVPSPAPADGADNDPTDRGTVTPDASSSWTPRP